MNPVRRIANRLANTTSVWLYRRTSGRIGGRGMGRRPVLLLTVPGRKSGRRHTVPVVYFVHGDDFLVVGTGLNGTSAIPQWFLNLEAAGTGHIQIREHEHAVNARLASGAEREKLWVQIASLAPHFAKWQARIGRTFPVVVLTPTWALD